MTFESLNAIGFQVTFTRGKRFHLRFLRVFDFLAVSAAAALTGLNQVRFTRGKQYLITNVLLQVMLTDTIS